LKASRGEPQDVSKEGRRGGDAFPCSVGQRKAYTSQKPASGPLYKELFSGDLLAEREPKKGERIEVSREEGTGTRKGGGQVNRHS